MSTMLPKPPSSSSSSSQVICNFNCVEIMNRNTMSFCTGVVTNARRSTRDGVPPLLDEIIFSILLLFPADILHDVMRYVCRQWYSIIHHHTFIYAHLARSSSGLLVTDNGNLKREEVETLDFMEITEGGIKMTKLPFPFPYTVSSSCNGLVLAVERKCSEGESAYHVYHVVNPLTKKIWTLPSFHKPSEIVARTGIAFAASVGKYKVVRCYYAGQTICCTMLSVGVDKAWRQINSENIPNNLIEVLGSVPKCTPGAFYWIRREHSCILELDAETEIFRQISLPEYNDNFTGCFAIMGNSLSVITCRSTYSWNVWVLGGSNTRQWIKMHTINVDFNDPVLKMARPIHEVTNSKTLYPIKWMKNGELLIFHLRWKTTKCVVYNVRTGKLNAYQIQKEAFYFNSLPHVRSLVSLNSS